MRRNSIRKTLAILSLLFSYSLMAQDSAQLEYADFIAIVKANHPLALSAQLESAKGDVYVQKAKGNFDPKVEAQFDEKYFNNNTYYSKFKGHIHIPTYWGLSAEAGYANADGNYLNPEMNLPDNGLYHAGLSLSLGKGLFIDERRASLKQAKLYREATDIQRQVMLNKLLYQASESYYKWFAAFHKWKIAQQAVNNAQIRLNAIEESVSQGLLAAIDTLEGKIQVQSLELIERNAYLNFQNALANMNMFFWAEGALPLELDSSVSPQAFSDLEFNSNKLFTVDKENIVNNHPEYTKLNIALQQQNINNSMLKEALKPTLDLKWNLLSETANANSYNPNNYTAGAYLSYPVFIRKERAELKLNSLMTEQLEYSQTNKRAELDYKIDMALNRLKVNSTLIEIMSEQLEGYTRMVQAENTLYLNGESSLFKVNSRELSLIKAQKEWIETIEQYYMARVEFSYITLEWISK